MGHALRVDDPLAQRRAERERLIGQARRFAEVLDKRLGARCVMLVGSLARGDFNVWSDIDLLVVAEPLPERLPERLALLHDGAPARVQVIGYTAGELFAAAHRRNRLVLDAAEHGIVLAGDRDPLDRITPRSNTPR